MNYFLLVADMQILLEQDSDRGQRPLSRVSFPLRRESGRLQTSDGRRTRKNQGGEEKEGSGQNQDYIIIDLL